MVHMLVSVKRGVTCRCSGGSCLSLRTFVRKGTDKGKVKEEVSVSAASSLGSGKRRGDTKVETKG